MDYARACTYYEQNYNTLRTIIGRVQKHECIFLFTVYNI